MFKSQNQKYVDLLIYVLKATIHFYIFQIKFESLSVATKTLLQFLERKYKRENSLIEKKGFKPELGRQPNSSSLSSSSSAAQLRPSPSHLSSSSQNREAARRPEPRRRSERACEEMHAAVVPWRGDKTP
jgi:hypothetical protein